jgi:hypothetical protein
VNDDQPSLGQFIWLVRRELQWAQEVDRDEPLRFNVESVELDLVVDATRTKEGGGGLDLKVFGVGLSAKADVVGTRQLSNTVHIVLSASETGGKKWQVGAEDREPPPRRAAAGVAPGRPASQAPALDTGAADLEPPPERTG